MGIQAAVRSDNTVTVEVVVAGRILTIVAAVGKDSATRNRALVAHTLVNKVPDVAALILRLLTNQIPVLLESTHRVTHSVGILALDERTRVVAVAIALAPIVISIHGAGDVGIASVVGSTLVLHGTGIVILLNPLVALLEVGTKAGLVTE